MSDSIPEPKITPLFEYGQAICRAHVWTNNGYSTRTFATHREASGWIESKSTDSEDD